nr:class I SAM-dependent methyltransferase [Limibaculum sediminis]
MSILSPYLSRARQAVVSRHVRGSVLDIGCQHGQLYDMLRPQISRYAGVDLDADAIQTARQKHRDCDFRVINIDDEPLGFESEFDTVVMMAVIEHIFNLKSVGQSLARALKPGGVVLVTTPTPFGNDIVHPVGVALGLFSRAAGDDHIAIFNRRRLEIFAHEIGLVLKSHRTFQFGCNQLAILQKP